MSPTNKKPQNDFLFSPLDLRYRSMLPESLSEQALLQAQVEVEMAWLESLMKAGLCPAAKSAQLQKAFAGIAFEEIEAIEQRTRHATRALVEALQNRLVQAGLSEQARWVHVGLTSFDTVDTAYRLRLKAFINNDYLPELERLEQTLTDLAKENAELICVGRTHGQYAVPSLFGLPFAEAAERCRKLRKHIETAATELCGQASGAIGGYQASSLLGVDALDLERDFLSRLGLKAHLGSVQTLPPEDMVFVAQQLYSTSAVAAKVANDLRHLARSEIAEVAEGMAPGQVGSSTMPQKRNPWNLEHVCSLYKVLYSKLTLLEVDMVTEHQRDLTNSASGRFYGEFFAVAYLIILRLRRVLGQLEVNTDQVSANLADAGSSVFAEAFYVLGTAQGVDQAHDKVREASRESEQSDVELFDLCLKKGLLPKGMRHLDELRELLLKGSRAKLRKLID